MQAIRSTLSLCVWLLVTATSVGCAAGVVDDSPTVPPSDVEPPEPPPPPPPPPPSGEVTVTDVSALPGSRLYVRADADPAPGIVALHGSEGGTERYIDDEARVLAEAGFAVLVFCWFDCPGKPTAISRIPLDDTLAAIRWLGASDSVQGRPVGVFGWSRGAEQAVLLASLLRDRATVAAVAVHAASDTVVCSYDPATEDSVYEQDPRTGRYIFGPAWTWQGQPLYGELESIEQAGPRIRVEDYPGDVYLSHGVNDDLWPVQRSQNIQSARDQAGLVTEPHYWQDEGHIIMDPGRRAEFRQTLTAFFARELR